MLEYIFFDKSLKVQFINWLDNQSIRWDENDSEEEFLVLLDEEIEDETVDLIEDAYDDLMLEQARLADQEDKADDAIHSVGVQFTRQDGSIGMVRLTPDQANKLTQNLSHEELQTLVQVIAESVENDDGRPLCKPE